MFKDAVNAQKNEINLNRSCRIDLFSEFLLLRAFFFNLVYDRMLDTYFGRNCFQCRRKGV